MQIEHMVVTQHDKHFIIHVHTNQYINECQFITFEGLSTTFEASMNVSFDTSLLILSLISDITIMHIRTQLINLHTSIYLLILYKAVILVK